MFIRPDVGVCFENTVGILEGIDEDIQAIFLIRGTPRDWCGAESAIAKSGRGA